MGDGASCATNQSYYKVLNWIKIIHTNNGLTCNGNNSKTGIFLKTEKYVYKIVS